MSTPFQAAVEAAQKVKDQSPDFDPRDVATINRECETMVRAAFSAAAENISRNVAIATKDAAKVDGMSELDALRAGKAVLDAIVREG